MCTTVRRQGSLLVAGAVFAHTTLCLISAKVLAEIGASGVVESMCHHIINLEAAEPATAALQALKGLCRLGKRWLR